MSGFDYSRIAATATRLLAHFGQPVTITRTAMDGAVSTSQAVGVVADTVKHALADTGIAIGDDKLYLSPAGTPPEPGDRIAYNGGSRVIVAPVIQLNPAGTSLLVECYARAG